MVSGLHCMMVTDKGCGKYGSELQTSFFLMKDISYFILLMHAEHISTTYGECKKICVYFML